MVEFIYMNPILIFNKNKVQAVLDRIVSLTQQDRVHIPITSEICPACGNRRYCSPKKATKILFYECSSFAFSRVLKNIGLTDPPVGENSVQFIPFRKDMET